MSLRACLRRTAFALLALHSACGGTTPTTPSPSDPSVRSVYIVGTVYNLFVGESLALTAKADLSDGSTEDVRNGIWTSDQPAVAVVSSTGVVLGVDQGTTIIFVDYHGKRGWKIVRVTRDYRGTWQGAYVVESCSGTGSLEDICCRSLFPKGVPLPVSLTLSQDWTRVVGTLTLGTTEGSVTGFVGPIGQLVIPYGGTVGPGMTTTLREWIALTVGRRMEGGFTFSVALGSTPGTVSITTSLRSVTRVSNDDSP